TVAEGELKDMLCVGAWIGQLGVEPCREVLGDLASIGGPQERQADDARVLGLLELCLDDAGRLGVMLVGPRPVEASVSQSSDESQPLDLIDPDTTTRDGSGCGAEEGRGKLDAAAGLVSPPGTEQQPVASGVDGEREAERLGVGAAGAQRQRPSPGGVQRLPLV